MTETKAAAFASVDQAADGFPANKIDGVYIFSFFHLYIKREYIPFTDEGLIFHVTGNRQPFPLIAREAGASLAIIKNELYLVRATSSGPFYKLIFHKRCFHQPSGWMGPPVFPKGRHLYPSFFVFI